MDSQCSRLSFIDLIEQGDPFFAQAYAQGIFTGIRGEVIESGPIVFYSEDQVLSAPMHYNGDESFFMQSGHSVFDSVLYKRLQ